MSRKMCIFTKSHCISFENAMAFILPIKQGADDHTADGFPILPNLRRCASALVTAAYFNVRLTPKALHALHLR